MTNHLGNNKLIARTANETNKQLVATKVNSR
jgi:hypothetical protein